MRESSEGEGVVWEVNEIEPRTDTKVKLIYSLTIQSLNII